VETLMTVVAYSVQFLEGDRSLDLISVGLAREDGASYYAVNHDANWAKIATNRWLCENVVPHLPLSSKGVRKATPGENTNVTTAWVFSIDRSSTLVKPDWVIANEVREFILGVDGPELWADGASYSHVVLCWLWGTLRQVPAGIPAWTRDVRQEAERAGSPVIPPPAGPAARNALDDAREVLRRLKWLREHALCPSSPRAASFHQASRSQ
jgi:hypothetical protein